MMHQDSLLDYAENDRFKFLRLPYRGKRCSMYVLLPKEILSVKELLSGVRGETVAELSSKATRHKVDVQFPKFTIKNHLNVKKTLASMGVNAAFDPNSANFDRMIVKTPVVDRMYLGDVYADGWMEVHEEGTEAAVATTTTHFPLGCSAPPKRPDRATFHANRPFMFLIKHRDSGTYLLAGWISEPKRISGG